MSETRGGIKRRGRRTTQRSNAARITIRCTGVGGRGPVYEATYDGKVIVSGARAPGLVACRRLTSWGVTGRLEMWREGKAHPDMFFDIERAARLDISEGPATPLQLTLWNGQEDGPEEPDM